MEKNEAQISDFAITKKAASPEKKIFSKKYFFQLICIDMIFKTVCGFCTPFWRQLSSKSCRKISAR